MSFTSAEQDLLNRVDRLFANPSGERFSHDTVKGFLIVYGGAAAGLITWIQSTFSTQASTTQQMLQNPLSIALLAVMIGIYRTLRLMQIRDKGQKTVIRATEAQANFFIGIKALKRDELERSVDPSQVEENNRIVAESKDILDQQTQRIIQFDKDWTAEVNRLIWIALAPIVLILCSTLYVANIEMLFCLWR